MNSTMTVIGRAARVAVAAIMMAALAACATPFNAQVSRFQSQLPAPQGQTFAVVPDDPALAGGIEFAQYAALVDKQMERLGYTAASSPEDASLLVHFDYSVDNGHERVQTTGPAFADPFYSPWYGYRPFGYRRTAFYNRGPWGFGFYDPFFDGPGIDSYTVYTSGIQLKIDNRNGERLFEGRAKAMSTSNRLQYLVPNLVEAMFTDFPGNSGETVRISIAPEKKTVRKVD